MKSLIVSKFYSDLEKLGLKKHKVSQEEFDFLELHNIYEKSDIMNQETDFVINRMIIKTHIANLLFVLFIVVLIASMIKGILAISVIAFIASMAE